MKKCCRCPEILPDNYFYQCCEKCRAKHSEQVKKIFADRKEKGLCQRCGKEKAQEGLTKCKGCAAKYFLEDDNVLRFTYKGNTFVNTAELQGKLKEKSSKTVNVKAPAWLNTNIESSKVSDDELKELEELMKEFR